MELSIVREKLFDFSRLDLVPIRRISVLSSLNFRKLEPDQDFSSGRHSVREEGGREESGLTHFNKKSEDQICGKWYQEGGCKL